MNRPTPAAVYYRYSDLKQEDSIARQQSQVEPYATAKGYGIVRDYVDEGISGTEADKRKAFMAMLADAQRGLFKVILVDDSDRFGRFDSIDYGYYVKPLRDKGVTLVSVAQGVIDWNSFAGRITSAALSEGKNTEQAANSRRVLSKMLLMAKDGKHLGGKPPYGLRLVRKAIDVPGRGTQLKPDYYEADGLKAEAVKLIFRLYDEGRSLAQVRTALHDRGIASPAGGEWWGRRAILEKLTNRKYTGAAAWGMRSEGLRHHQKRGEIHEKKPGGKRCIFHQPEDWVIVPDRHEALVDQELFARVQARLRGGRKLKGRAGECGRFLLSKLLVCGHCGHYLCGTTVRGERQYLCSGYLDGGPGFCHRNLVREKPVVRLLVRQLQQAFLNPANLEALREQARRVEDQARGPDNQKRLQKRLAALEKDLTTANRNLLLLPPDRLAGAAEQLRAMEKERDGVKAELDLAESFSPVATLEEEIRGVEQSLFVLHEALEADDDLLLRQLLLQCEQGRRAFRAPDDAQADLVAVRPGRRLPSPGRAPGPAGERRIVQRGVRPISPHMTTSVSSSRPRSSRSSRNPLRQRSSEGSNFPLRSRKAF
jgi:DNA invertase Pin-like site-specific DNA recombinase